MDKKRSILTLNLTTSLFSEKTLSIWKDRKNREQQTEFIQTVICYRREAAATMSIIERDSVEGSRIDRKVFSALSRARPHMTPIQQCGGPGGRSVERVGGRSGYSQTGWISRYDPGVGTLPLLPPLMPGVCRHGNSRVAPIAV